MCYVWRYSELCKKRRKKNLKFSCTKTVDRTAPSLRTYNVVVKNDFHAIGGLLILKIKRAFFFLTFSIVFSVFLVEKCTYRTDSGLLLWIFYFCTTFLKEQSNRSLNFYAISKKPQKYYCLSKTLLLLTESIFNYSLKSWYIRFSTWLRDMENLEMIQIKHLLYGASSMNVFLNG